MSSKRRALGMDRAISRRDFVNGVAALTAGGLMPGCVTSGPFAQEIGDRSIAHYPPVRQGMRGSHAGSFEVAHDLAFRSRTDWGPVGSAGDGEYDLVVVGAGLSGLSAAFFQLQKDPSARILILDNHDDFGGHAKRNEFTLGNRTVLGYGGSQTLESPAQYSEVSKKLLRDLGVELERFDKAYDRDFYIRHGLGAGVFFDRATYGVDRLVRQELLEYSGYMPLAPSPLSAAEAIAEMPISEPARVELLRLMTTEESRMLDVPPEKQELHLWKMSYRAFLERYLDIHEPEVFQLLQGISTDVGLSLDASTAIDQIGYVGMPGIGATDLPRFSFEDDPYIAHFPDGNASIARLLVRRLIPGVASGRSAEDVVAAYFDYSRLDEPGAPVRLRLSSTVVGVEHDGKPDSADRVAIKYIQGGRAHRVFARSVLLAGYNAMIPHLCPELPERQRKALALAVKSPILYSTVLLSNWRAWQELGVGAVSAPGSYHTNSMLDFPVSLGGYSFSASPDEPIIVHMERFGYTDAKGMTARDQFRAERHRLLTTPFEKIEHEIRTQLAGTLAGGDFDPARDIEAITVNRWAHGYAQGPNPLFDEIGPAEESAHVIGRARFGRIAIANSDAGGRATIDSAIDQADRAINELAQI